MKGNLEPKVDQWVCEIPDGLTSLRLDIALGNKRLPREHEPSVGFATCGNLEIHFSGLLPFLL